MSNPVPVTFKEAQNMPLTTKDPRNFAIVGVALIVAAALFAGFYFLGPMLNISALNNTIAAIHQMPALACGGMAVAYSAVGAGLGIESVKKAKKNRINQLVEKTKSLPLFFVSHYCADESLQRRESIRQLHNGVIKAYQDATKAKTISQAFENMMKASKPYLIFMLTENRDYMRLLDRVENSLEFLNQDDQFQKKLKDCSAALKKLQDADGELLELGFEENLKQYQNALEEKKTEILNLNTHLKRNEEVQKRNSEIKIEKAETRKLLGRLEDIKNRIERNKELYMVTFNDEVEKEIIIKQLKEHYQRIARLEKKWVSSLTKGMNEYDGRQETIAWLQSRVEVEEIELKEILTKIYHLNQKEHKLETAVRDAKKQYKRNLEDLLECDKNNIVITTLQQTGKQPRNSVVGSEGADLEDREE